MRLIVGVLLCLRVCAADADLKQLLLTPKRLHRLKLDRERQTDRWLIFEQRVNANQDSSERGVELAIYAAVSGDAAKAREAIAWTLRKPCTALAKALVENATADQQTPDETAKLNALVCPDGDRPLARFGVTGPPEEFLLSLKPAEVEHPTWQQHVAALLLVAVAPNARSSQFLQGWAMEDRFTVHDGPGVVYEFLYADPYLPGVSYQNMDPWSYRPGSLHARSDWSPDACWVHISSSGREQEHCPPNLWSQPSNWGNLILIPLTRECINIAATENGSIAMIGNAPREGKLLFIQGADKRTYHADDAGLWQVPQGPSAKVCPGR